MKHFTKLFTASLLLAFSGFAHANLITMTDEYNVKQTVSTARSVMFLHDFTDEDYEAGFDTIVSASLELSLQDKGNNEGGAETYTLKFTHDGVTLISGANLPNGKTTLPAVQIDGDPLALLGSTGQLWFTLAAQSGDFEFFSSKLTATYREGVKPVDVPEPFSVALVGIGLAAIGAARRRKV